MRRYCNRMKIEPALGTLGLLLMLLVARLTPAAYDDHTAVPARMSGFLARRAIDAIAFVGWLADRLPSTSLRTGPFDFAPGKPSIPAPSAIRATALGRSPGEPWHPSTHWRL